MHRVAAIKFAHRVADLPLPTDTSAVRLALRRVSRATPRRPKQALGLTNSLLQTMLTACSQSLSGLRDAALICVGYDTLCRSCELVGMRLEHLAADRSSLCIPRSKADWAGDGRIAFLSPSTVQRLNAWLAAAKLESGPLFQGVHTGRPSGRLMDTSSVRRLIKRLAKQARLPRATVAALSGHSLRVGAAQDMMLVGCETISIMQAGGWRTHRVVARYVENASAKEMHERRWWRLKQMAASASGGSPETLND